MDFSAIAEGLSYIFSLQNLLFMLIGMFIGIVFGAIPGLNGGIAIIVLLPFTFSMDPMTGILMLIAVYNGGTYGGSITAILLGTPGTTGSAATVIDGYALAKKGYPKKALDIALYASVIGGIVGSLLLLFASPLISSFAMKMAPPEMFCVALLGLAIVAGIGGNNLLSGFGTACFGMLVSCVGMSALTGTSRFTFSVVNLLKGLDSNAVLVGIFALPLVFASVRKGSKALQEESSITSNLVSKEDDKLTKKDLKIAGGSIAKSSAIGSIVGAIPGAGINIAAYLGYSEAKRKSKHPEEFGEGSLEGIVAPEAANNDVCASSFVPLLTLGIPGSVVAAILLGALTMHGIVPGPMMVITDAGYFYGIIFGFIVAQIFMLMQGKLLLNVFRKVTSIPGEILMPLLVVFCCVGMYSLSSRVFDIGIFMVMGFVFYILSKFGAAGPGFVLGFVLGPILEFNLDGAMVLGKGSWTIFLTRPISVVFIIISIALFILMYKQNASSSKSVKGTMKTSGVTEEEENTVGEID